MKNYWNSCQIGPIVKRRYGALKAQDGDDVILKTEKKQSGFRPKIDDVV